MASDPSSEDVINTDGSRQRNLTSNPANEHAFADGSEQRNLTRNPADDGLVAWSPVRRK